MNISLVAGGGGFIGGHLVKALLERGDRVVVADIKPMHEWCQVFPEATNHDLCDLGEMHEALFTTYETNDVFMLAADMGGMGFIENNKLDCMLSVIPSTSMLLGASSNMVERYLYASSACVYAADKQTDPNVTALKESDAYPAEAEDGYGWEKLFTERMCRHFREDRGLNTSIARFHNVYGPNGTYDGGREKAPAAICRKVIEAKLSGSNEISIWGDGEQTRSFMYVSDCVEGMFRILDSDYHDPLNLGSSELVSINDLVGMVEDIAGVKLNRTYDLSAPQGVRGRNSDNTLLLEKAGWEPSVGLYSGIEATYSWIYKQMVS